MQGWAQNWLLKMYIDCSETAKSMLLYCTELGKGRVHAEFLYTVMIVNGL